MQRRDFIKTLAIGTASIAVPAASSVSRAGETSESDRAHGGERTERAANAQRVRSGMALGGIGAGSVELRKDGRFYNWNIGNNLPKETGSELNLPVDEAEDPEESLLFFKVRYQVEGERPQMKLLQLSNSLNEGKIVSAAYLFPWMEAVDCIEYSARFPFCRLRFTDPEMPFDLEMDAWSSFIPHNVKDSSLPNASFDFTVKPKIRKPVKVLLLFAARNLTGYDLPERYHTTQVLKAPGRASVVMSCGGIDKASSSWGEIAISVLSDEPSYYAGWDHLHPYYEYVIRHESLPNLDDTDGKVSLEGGGPSWMPATHGRNARSKTTGRQIAVHELMSTVGATVDLDGSMRETSASFLYSWNFPNLYAEDASRNRVNRIEGHFYSNFFSGAAEIVDYAVENRISLRTRSRAFLDDFFDSSIEVFALEQVNSQLNTFLTSGRLVKNGDFGIQEGLTSTKSWAAVATIDVMLYGTVPIIALFPELQKATMRCHARCQGENGEIAHGFYKNFEMSEDNTAGVFHRLDLSGQFVIMAMRDFFWTNDLGFLKGIYPSLKSAVDYVLKHRAFAGDRMPIPRGIESSYDNFPMFGYSSYLLTQWLCAMASIAEGARALGKFEEEATYRAILESGRKLFEDKLWNGRYYRLYNDLQRSGGRGDTSEACLTDQLVGQWAAHQSALGDLSDRRHIDDALRSILRTNYVEGFGLRNCGWPGYEVFADVPADMWVDQGNTFWTGVELAFASLLIYRGLYSEGMSVVETVDRRYRKNGLYWDHQECGGHYFRPMSAWSLINAALGLGINQGRFRIDPKIPLDSFKLFFVTPTGTAQFIKTTDSSRIRCLTGSLEARSVEVPFSYKACLIKKKGTERLPHSPNLVEDRFWNWDFGGTLILGANEEIEFSKNGIS